MKLTFKQNEVIWCLQNGWELITYSSMNGAIVANKDFDYHIDNGVFWRLYNKGLIYQGDWKTHRFGYVLTPLGKEIKTKPVTF